MAQQWSEIKPFNDFDDMDLMENGEMDEIDKAMSQMKTDETGNLVNDMDEMDQAMSQIDTELIERMEKEVVADVDPDNIPVELLEQYQLAMNDILPNKSGNRYLQAYDVFRKWQTENGTNSFDERVIMAYFLGASKRLAPTTLWSMYSMLKKTLICKHNVDVSKFTQLLAFLKKQADGYESKKANVFTPEDINKFITEAPDVLYLGMKVVLVFGVSGACRGDELTKLVAENVKDDGKQFLVKIPKVQIKTKSPKTYIISSEFAKIVRQYVQLRPPNVNTNRFFLQYRNGKCVNQVIGKNSIAKVPKEVATFQKLPEPGTYTGHSYRRTSATIVADAGASFNDLKRFGQWKGNAMVDRYVQDSLTRKRKIGNFISGAVNLPSESTVDVTDGAACNNIHTENNVEPMSMSTVGAGKSSQNSKSVGIKIPDNTANITLRFDGECSNFTIINMK